MKTGNKLSVTFLGLILLQALHSAEEFIFKLYEVFPPMRLLYAGAPRVAQAAFLIFNSVLITAGLICFFRWVRPGRRGAREVVWAWTGVEMFNAAAHFIWAVNSRGYNPGLVTGLGFVPVTAYLVYLLRRTPASAAA